MDMLETRAYIRHRMEVAGETGGVTFTPFATRCIFYYTRGVPRMINILCDRALLMAYGDERRRISAVIITRAIMELLHVAQGKRLSLAITAVVIIAITSMALTMNLRHLIPDMNSSRNRQPVASPLPHISERTDQSPKTGASTVAASHAGQQFSQLKQEILAHDQKSFHLLAFNSVADKLGVRRITILGGDIFTVPKMFSRFAAVRDLRVTEFKGTLDDAIRFKRPFLVVTKFSDTVGPYCIAVTSAENDSVTTSPAFFGERSLSKNDLNTIAAGTFYLIRKETVTIPDKTKSVPITPPPLSSGSTK
jgi:general secretion pathway protein A